MEQKLTEVDQTLSEIDRMLNEYAVRVLRRAGHGFTINAVKEAWFGAEYKELTKLRNDVDSDIERTVQLVDCIYKGVVEKTKAHR